MKRGPGFGYSSFSSWPPILAVKEPSHQYSSGGLLGHTRFTSTYYSRTMKRPPSLRPKVSGKYISYAVVGMTRNSPGTLARIKYVYS